MEESTMDGEFYEVQAPLSDVGSHFYHLHTSAAAEVVLKHLSPNFDMLMLFNFGAPVYYYDQSHLIKDFNHFLGTTPRKFLKNIAGKGFCITRPGKHY